jgi:hypothetical protein
MATHQNGMNVEDAQQYLRYYRQEYIGEQQP